MQNVNTQGRLPGRLNSMYVQVFKAPLPIALKTSLVATVFCCLFSQNLVAQCCPISQPQGAFINLSLDNTGNVQINPNVFVPYVGSSNSPCLPVNGGIIQLWSDATATTPFPNTNYNCTHIGTQVNVYVTLDIPGVCANPPVAPFVVEIVDFVAPIVSGLSPSQTVNAAPGTCAATVTGLTPTITDNCSNTYRLGWIKTGATTSSCAGVPGTYPGPCTTANGSFNVGITTVTFHVIYQVSITPLNEDTITLVRTVTVNDTQAPTYNLPGYSQSSSPLNADAMCVGTPNWSYPTASDNCGVTKYRVKLTYPNASTSLHDINPGTGVATPPLPATLPLGTTQVRDTLSDGTPSGTIVHAYNVVVQDVTAPVWTGIPPVLNVGATANCEAAVTMNYSDGSYFSDNCTPDNLIDTTVTVEVITGGPAPYTTRSHTNASATFPDGQYRIIFAAADASGNVGRDTIILTVADNEDPTANCLFALNAYIGANGTYVLDGLTDLDDGSFDNCTIQSDSVRFSPFTPGNPWLPSVTLTCSQIPLGPLALPVQMKITDASGNTDVCQTYVNVFDTLPPIAQCKNIMVNLSAGSVVVNATDVNNDIPNNSYDNCVSPLTNFQIRKGNNNNPPFFNSVTFDCTEVGPQLVTLRVRDGQVIGGNDGFCVATVTVKDLMPPTPVVCNSLTVYLDADGEASVNDKTTRTYNATGLPVNIPQPPPTPDMVMHILNVPTNSTISDVNMSLLINQNLVGDLRATLTSPMGTTITLFDRPGYSAGPGLGCLQDNLNVKFDDSAFFTASDFENSCNGLPFAIQGTYRPVNPMSAFIGQNMMGNWTLTVYDHNNLNAPGAATIQAWSLQITDAVTTNLELLGAGSMDDCPNNLSWSAFPSSFDCTDLGPNTYTLTVTDGTNAVTCQNTITVVDEIPPTAICKPATLPLDALGNATLLPSMVNDNSTDNCVSNLTYSVSPNTFDCSDIGGFPTVTLSVSDGTHTSTCEATVTVIDNIPPVPACTAISVPLGSNGEVTVLAQQLALASYDACGIASYEISVDTDNNGIPDSFFDIFATLDCDYVDDDPVQVSIRVTDGSGNFSICNTTIDVQDNELPILTIPADVTIECDDPQTPDAMNAVGIATATDNTDDCHPVVPTKVDVIPADSYLCDDAYTIVRTWTATDFYGNTVSADQIITVRDFTAPTFTRPSDALAVECPASTLIANKVGPITVASTNVPVAISASGTPTVSSTLNFTGVGKVLDLNVKNLGITHTFSGDLRVVLTSPSGTSVRLFDQLCSSADNVNISFDDQSVSPYSSIPCGPLGGAGTYRSLAPLSIFNGEASNGIWTLTVFDLANLDGGSLDSWSLEITYAQPGTVAQTGDVTNEADNCMPETRQAYFVDYQAYKGFVNHTAPVAYNLTGTPSSSNGSSASANSTTVTLVSDNNGLPIGDATYALNNPIPANGYVIFDWSYTTTDLPERDSFGYVLNGVFTQLSDDMGGPSQLNNRVVLPVNAMNTFGFAMRSRTGATGAATAVITNFIFTDLATPTLLDMCEHKFSLARFWTMVDDCGNQAPYQVQCITTQDTQRPSIVLPATNVSSNPTATMTILANGAVCTPFVNLKLDALNVTDGCSDFADMEVTNTAFSSYGLGNGTDDASGYYFPGTYNIRFIVEDECQNRDTLDLTLIVIDNQQPTAVCQNLTVQLDNTGNACITPVNVNNGSTDNCGIVSMSLSQSCFTTADVGQNTVTLTVTDAAGLTNSCPSIITVLGGLTFDIADVNGGAGSMQMVPVTVAFFDNITSFNFTVDIVDGNVATFASPYLVPTANLSPNTSPNFVFNQVSPTKLLVTWISPSPTGLDIADFLTVFNLKVMISNTAAIGTSTPVIISNASASMNGNAISLLGLSGNITVVNAALPKNLTGSFLEIPACGTDLVHFTNVALTGTSTSSIANAAGTYAFSVPTGSNSTITPTRNTAWTGSVAGVLINDVNEIQKYLAALPNLVNSPYKLLAADIDGNNAVQSLDAFKLNQLILNGGNPAGITTLNSWRFVPASPALAPLPANPFPIGNQFISYTNVTADMVGDFIGIKMGDVTCDVQPIQMFGGTAEERSVGLTFEVKDQAVAAGQEFSVIFNARDFTNMSSYQATIGFNAHDLEFVSLMPGNLVNLTDANFNPARVNEGLISTTWYNVEPMSVEDGTGLFNLTFKSLKDVSSIADLIWMNSDFIPAVAFTESGEAVNLEVVFEGTTTAAGEELNSRFALYQNQPNPFGVKTSIAFMLPRSTHTKLTISDASGRVLKVMEADYTAGYHQVFVDRKDLASNGVVFYRLETPTHTATKKMVLLD